ncbi:hypothetical protein MTO96_011799 [Rhipicephalus appendiculatus]
MRAHTLPRSLEAASGGSKCLDDASGDTNAIRGLNYCDPKTEVNGDYRAPSLLGTTSHAEARSSPTRCFPTSCLPVTPFAVVIPSKRSALKLLLNGTCPAADMVRENADGGHSVTSGLVVSGGSEAVSINCGPLPPESMQADPGVASGAESSNESKFLVAHSDTEHDEVSNTARDSCKHEISFSAQDLEHASNDT